MKKFFATLLIAMALIFGIQNNFAEAEEVFMGTHPSSNMQAYLITDTIEINDDSFTCTVISYYKNQHSYVKYYFFQNGGDFYYQTDANLRPLKLSENTVVENNIYKYVWLGER